MRTCTANAPRSLFALVPMILLVLVRPSTRSTSLSCSSHVDACRPSRERDNVLRLHVHRVLRRLHGHGSRRVLCRLLVHPEDLRFSEGRLRRDLNNLNNNKPDKLLIRGPRTYYVGPSRARRRRYYHITYTTIESFPPCMLARSQILCTIVNPKFSRAVCGGAAGPGRRKIRLDESTGTGGATSSHLANVANRLQPGLKCSRPNWTGALLARNSYYCTRNS